MKIRLHILYIVAVLAVLFTDRVFWEFFFTTPDDPFLRYYGLGISAAGLGLATLYYGRLERHMRWWFWILNVSIALLALESYGGWGRWMAYPHVFEKLTVLWLTFGVYAFHQRFGPPPMRLLIFVLLAAVIGNLIFYHPNALSLTAFLDQERGVSASSVQMLVMAALLALGWYLKRGSVLAMALLFASLGLIVFLQHRSVWTATAVAIPVFLFLLRQVPDVRVSLPKLTLLVLVPLIASMLGGVAAVINDPGVMRRMEQNIDDITHADKQGTGGWRVKQTKAYIPVVEERPVLGWRLEGFELPMQFYDPASDMPMWADHTGHHFHSFYMDRLFYFGLAGLLLTLLFPIVQAVRYVRYPGGATAESAAMLAYFVSLLVYGISYDWSPYHYGLLGLVLAALEAHAREAAPRRVPTPPADEPAYAAPAALA